MNRLVPFVSSLLLCSIGRAVAFAPHHVAMRRGLTNTLWATEQQQETDELVRQDSASTTPQLLSSLWDMIAQGSSMVRGVSSMRISLFLI